MSLEAMQNVLSRKLILSSCESWQIQHWRNYFDLLNKKSVNGLEKVKIIVKD